MAAPKNELEVRFETAFVGRLLADDVGRIGFTYGANWLADRAAFPISLSLPMRAEAFASGAAHAFFANLLPEGGVRTAVCRKLGISESNDMALLRAIGGECAGALTVVDPDQPPSEPAEAQYEVLTARQLKKLVTSEAAVPLLVGGPTTRLSLAGAQDKLPVALLDDHLHLPMDGSPSTHILKLPNRRFAHLPVNEAFITGLAGRLGLDVAKVELTSRTSPPSLLVERYDRIRTEQPWPARRLHQEDLCQALGLPPSRKYEEEGGPTLVAAVSTIRDHVRQPLTEVRRIIEWQAFNVIVGNSDGHGKNLSILYTPEGPRLAPFYDLVSTRAYKGLDGKLAMGVGSQHSPDILAPADWGLFAKDVGVASRVVHELVRQLASRCLDAVDPWRREFEERHGRQPALQTLPRDIKKRARKVLGLTARER